MTSPEWKSLVEAAMAARPVPIQANTYGGTKFETGSKPVLLRCSDGNDYVVKGKQVGKALIIEQIVGALGVLVGAPVPRMPLVDVPADLIAKEEKLKHMAAGIAHGCLYFSNGVQQSWVQNIDVPQNKERHARLAILYGWVNPGDRQLHYELYKTALVWSMDHGLFDLRGGGGAPYPDMVRDARITPEALAAVKPFLEAVQPEGIARAVASPHESWGITLEERISYAQHFEQKRIQLVASIA